MAADSFLPITAIEFMKTANRLVLLNRSTAG